MTSPTAPDVGLREKAQRIAQETNCHARHAGVPCRMTMVCSCALEAGYTFEQLWPRYPSRASAGDRRGASAEPQGVAGTPDPMPEGSELYIDETGAKYHRPPPAAEREALRDELQGLEATEAICFDRVARRLKEAETAVTLLRARVQKHVSRAKAAERWAADWHRIVEATLTVMGLSPALGGDEAARAIQAGLADRDRRLAAAVGALRPFAALIDEIDEARASWRLSPLADDVWVIIPRTVGITHGDLRRARTARDKEVHDRAGH